MIVREPWVSRLLVAAVGVFVLVVSGCAHEGGSAARSGSPASAEAREPLPWGSLVLRGVVTWEGKPVAGVTVSAVPHADVPLSARALQQLRETDTPLVLALSSGEALQRVLAALPSDLVDRMKQAHVVAASERLRHLARGLGFTDIEVAPGPRPADLIDAAARRLPVA